MARSGLTAIGSILVLELALWTGLAMAQDVAVGGITVSAPWARATPGGAKVGAAFLEIRAQAGADDRLMSASSPAAGTVELHDHIRDGGVIKMRRVETIPVQGGKSVTLKPGGLHVMLMDLKAGLTEGELLELTLVFEKAGAVKVPVPIARIGAMTGTGAPGTDQGSGSGSGSTQGSGSGSGSGAGPKR